MSQWIRIPLIAAAALTVAFLFVNFVRYSIGPPAHKPEETQSFIVANPLDLSQIKALSQFRSCVGHNFSGLNTSRQEETYRSMKHYIEPLPALAKTAQQVKIFSPFTGNIKDLQPGSPGWRVDLAPTDGPSGWHFIFFHVDLLPTFNQAGAAVTAGEHIGFATLTHGSNFDMGLKQFGFRGQLFASPFEYMNDAVLAQYAAHGITPNKIILTKEARDAAPCQLQPGQSGRDAFFVSQQRGSDWVDLQ